MEECFFLIKFIKNDSAYEEFILNRNTNVLFYNELHETTQVMHHNRGFKLIQVNMKYKSN